MAKKTIKKGMKKQVKITHPKPAPKRKLDKHVVYIGILLIIIAVILFLLFTKETKKEVVAVVNGQEITTKDVELVAKFLPDNQKASATEELLLNQTIDEILLMQDAERRGIKASAEEINAALQEAVARSGLSQADLNKYLAEKNVTQEDMNAFFRKQVIFTKMIMQVSELQVTVTEDDVAAFYEQNKAQIPAPYEAAKDQIRGYLRNQKLAQAFTIYLNKLRSGSDIKIIKQ